MALLALARGAIERAVAGGDEAQPPASAGVLAEPLGVFVTLRNAGQIRGCIGTLGGRAPLHDAVRRMAVSAATEDPRFEGLSAAEVGAIDIEISVLSPARAVAGPADVQVGRHGVIAERGSARGVLLPQVAAERGWSSEQLLDHVCLKAGLDLGAWRRVPVDFRVFSAQVITDAGQR